MKKAILVGGTGLIGGHCLDILLEHSEYDEVILLLRTPREKKHPKLVQHSIDFNDLTAHQELIQGSDLFCCLGTTIKKAGSQDAFRTVDYTYPLEIAKIARGNNISRYSIVTALGAKANSSIFYNQVKGELEKELKALSFPSLQIFQPSLLVGDRNESRLGEDLAQKAAPLMAWAMQGPLKKYRPIQGKTVAFAMVNQAQKAPSGNETFHSRTIQKIFDENNSS